MNDADAADVAPTTGAPTRLGAEPPYLRTTRLVLRPFRVEDAADVQRLAGAAEIAATTLHVPHPYPDGMAEQWIATHAPAWAGGEQATYAVTARDDRRLIGAIGLSMVPAHARAELGYWIGVSEWGRGYATEAGAAVLALAFGPLAMHRVQAQHLVRNPASGRVLQKLAMRCEGVRRGVFRKNGRFEDAAMYATLADDWRASFAEHPLTAPADDPADDPADERTHSPPEAPPR